MDLPVENAIEIDATADPEADPVSAPARNTRSAQRRRAVSAASVTLDDPIGATTKPAPADRSLPTVPPAEPAFNPPAAIVADIVTEETVMDTVNTAETVKNTADQMVDQGQAMTADMSGRAKEAMEKSTKMAEELGSFSKGNLEALVESSKIATKGMEAIAQEAAEFSRKSFESATAAMKTLSATRSPTEFMKLQSDYTRSMFDMMVAETTKSTEMMMKLANEIAQPLSNRVAIAAEKMKTSA